MVESVIHTHIRTIWHATQYHTVTVTEWPLFLGPADAGYGTAKAPTACCRRLKEDYQMAWPRRQSSHACCPLPRHCSRTECCYRLPSALVAVAWAVGELCPLHGSLGLSPQLPQAHAAAQADEQKSRAGAMRAAAAASSAAAAARRATLRCRPINFERMVKAGSLSAQGGSLLD